MRESETLGVSKIAFEKNSVMFGIVIMLMLCAVRWYMLQKEHEITYQLGCIVAKFATHWVAPERDHDLTIMNAITLVNISDSNTFQNVGYDKKEQEFVTAELKYSDELFNKKNIEQKQYVDLFYKTQNATKQTFLVRINLAFIKDVLHDNLVDVMNLVAVLAITLYFIFLYLSGQLKAQKIESDHSRKKLKEINKDLREQQDAVLKNQTALMLSNNQYEIINEQLVEYTNDLENSKQAMFNILQDVELSRQEANRANSAKSVFLASMSHEIRTPMNGVLGMIDICLTTSLTEEQKDYLETAHSAGKTLMSLLNDILDFSKIEAEKLEIENMEFDFRRTIREVVLLFRQSIYERGLEFLVRVDPNVPRVIMGDSTRVRQVLSNIIGNSAKFTEKGNISVMVRVEKNNISDKLHIEISDTGMGMTPEQCENLFKPFTQADASITRRFGGTGLGLTISKKLANLMGGDIIATAEVGKGSTFLITLPLKTVTPANFPVELRLKEKSFLVLMKNDILFENVAWCLQQLGVQHHRVESLEDLQYFDTAKWAGCIWESGEPELEKCLRTIQQCQKKNETFRSIGIFNFLEIEFIKHLRNKMGCEVLYKPIFLESFQTLLTEGKQAYEQQEEKNNRIGTINERVTKSANILVAEDNVINQKVIKSYLEKIGFSNVNVVANGQEALDFLDDNPVDIIFMDIQMPVLDGLKTTEKIREYEKQDKNKPHVTIIALTAHSYIGEQQRCFDAGVDDYIGKPIQLDRLLVCLEKWGGLLVERMENKGEKSVQRPTVGDEKASLSTSENVTPEIDWVMLDITKETLGKSFPDVVSMFVRDTLERLAVIESAISKGNKEEMRLEIHQLKSSAGSFGAVKIEKYSKELEEFSFSKRYTSEGAHDMLSKIRAEFEMVKSFLHRQSKK